MEMLYTIAETTYTPQGDGNAISGYALLYHADRNNLHPARGR